PRREGPSVRAEGNGSIGLGSSERRTHPARPDIPQHDPAPQADGERSTVGTDGEPAEKGVEVARLVGEWPTGANVEGPNRRRPRLGSPHDEHASVRTERQRGRDCIAEDGCRWNTVVATKVPPLDPAENVRATVGMTADCQSSRIRRE